MGQRLVWLIVITSLASCMPFAGRQGESTIVARRAPTMTSTPVPSKTPAPLPTDTQQPTPTQVSTNTSTPDPTPIAITDDRLVDLEDRGYRRSEMSSFTVTTLGGDLAFGGPDATGASSQAVFGSLVYLQYTHPDTQNCMLVFASQTEESIFDVIGIIDASQLSPALHAVVTPQQDWLPSLNCSPMGWGDINRNGKSDMAVTFLWANHITGSETHIFEVQEDSTVVDLVADLPGIVSPWSFDPSDSSLYVFDMEFAHHDCMYPPLSVIWVYDWRDGDYKDVTAEWDFSDYLESLQTTVEDGYGSGFSPYLFLEPLTQLLTMYDRQGRRAEGWNLYLDMADLENWPGTDAESETWLKSDVQHFTEQYERGVPFTANNYCTEQ